LRVFDTTRAFLAAISAFSSEPIIFSTPCWRLTPTVMISSYAARMPASCNAPIISRISERSVMKACLRHDGKPPPLEAC
jgi:hypothetical protein